MSEFHPSSETIDAWANGMLNEATDDMVNEGIEITPESLSTYFEKHYGFTFTPTDAKQWLEEQAWYFTNTQEQERRHYP